MSKLSFQVNQAESEGCRLFNGKCFFLEERLKLTKPFQAENPHLRIFTLYLLRDPRASLADIKVFYAKKSLANTKVFMPQKVLLISHMGPEGPFNFTKKLKGSVSAIFFFIAT